MTRRAKIVATLGPASSGAEEIEALLAAGVDVVRLNLSHETHEWHRERIRLVREAAAAAGLHLPVMLDLMGPRYRLAAETPRRRLEEGETVVLAAAGIGSEGNGGGDDDGDIELPVGEPEVLAHMAPGDRVLIDQGMVELRVEERAGDRVTARVVAGGEVGSRKGINLPDSDLGFRITEKDRADLAFAVAEGVDWLAASYVGRAADVEAVRREAGAIPIIAKLERGRAIENLDEIVAAADAVMVARGDLGVEVPIERVPVLQKRIIAAGRARGRPVIVATQMLESMMEQPRPTRAEATDVANAVFDGADALMLSGETAAGRHAVASVETMARIIATAEDYGRTALAGASDLRRDGLDRGGRSGDDGDGPRPAGAVGRLAGGDAADVPDTVAAAAVYAAHELAAHRLVAFSQSGSTALYLARYRPSAPMVVFASSAEVARRLQLVWGVRPHHLEAKLDHHDEVIELVDRELLAHGLAEPGHLVVALMGDPIRERRQTNLMRVHRVRTAAEWERARGTAS